MTKAELQKKYDELEELYADLSRDVVQVSLERDRFQSTVGVRDAQLHDAEKVCKKLSESESKAILEVYALEEQLRLSVEHLQRVEKGYMQRGVALDAAYTTLKCLIQDRQEED